MNVLFLYPNLQGMNMLPPAIGLFVSLLRMNGHKVDLFDSTNHIIPARPLTATRRRKRSSLYALLMIPNSGTVCTRPTRSMIFEK